MQKSEDLPQPALLLKKISLEITEALNDKVLGEEENFVRIQNLYAQRQRIINQISQWLESVEGKNYIAVHKESWNNFFREIAEQEKRNIQILDITTVAAKQKLREVVQNKAILLYTKG